ncbi:MAG: hypothetical protein K0S32_2416 [Bacteroidetes bacterium]|jgi:hypothetical protein|nr:hypothetical protein [Bacteroidota bacterium]
MGNVNAELLYYLSAKTKSFDCAQGDTQSSQSIASIAKPLRF